MEDKTVKIPHGQMDLVLTRSAARKLRDQLDDALEEEDYFVVEGRVAGTPYELHIPLSRLPQGFKIEEAPKKEKHGG